MPTIRQILRTELLYTVGTVLSVGVNAAFYLLGHLLTAPQFSEMVTLVSVAYFLSIGEGAIEAYVITCAKRMGGTKGLHREAWKALFILWGITMVIAVALASPVAHALHFTSTLPFIGIGVGSVALYSVGVAKGFFVVRRQTGAYALAMVAEVGARFPIGYFLFTHGYSTMDSVWIVVGSYAVAGILSLWMLLRGRDEAPQKHTAATMNVTPLATIAITSLLFTLTMKSDLFWAKHELSAADSGIYAAIATVAMLVSLGLGTVSRTTVTYLSIKNLGQTFRLAVLMMLGIAVLVMLGFLFAGNFALTVFFGAPFAGHTLPLLLLLFGMACTSIIGLCVQYLNILGKRLQIGLSIVLLALQFLGLGLFGHSLLSIAVAQTSAVCLSALVFVIVLLRQKSMNTVSHNHVQSFTLHRMH